MIYAILVLSLLFGGRVPPGTAMVTTRVENVTCFVRCCGTLQAVNTGSRSYVGGAYCKWFKLREGQQVDVAVPILP